MRIVLLGPPGSGKGTIAKIIEELYCVPAITTGDMLRDAAERGTSLGRTAKLYMDRGELVPDELVISLVRERLSMSDSANGFVLDGYPRSVRQAEALDEILLSTGKKLDCVLSVELEDDVIVKRLSARRSCPKCGAVYNLMNKPPSKHGTCDVCGSTLVQRNDDKPEVIRRRLDVYREKTQLLLDWYSAKGEVKKIRGDLPLEQLPSKIRKTLEL